MSKIGSYKAAFIEGVKSGTREFFSPVVYLIKLIRKLVS